MDFKVLKGYNPDELSHWETENVRKEWIALALILGAFASLIVFMMLNPEPSIENGSLVDNLVFFAMICWSFGLLLCGFTIDQNNVNHRKFRDAVCNALAGLELGVYHCADDLVIHLHLSWERANQIIDGQYDDWLRHKKTCQFMPNGPVLNPFDSEKTE